MSFYDAVLALINLYFQTKIMNEGWASFWHMRIMRELDLTDDEFTEFARLHSSVCTPGRTRINPYYVGLKIWEDIEARFGRPHIFEVRELENDVSFLRLYLTEQLVEDLDLFVFALEEDEWLVTDKAWERVRDALVESMTNFGQPYLTVQDADYNGTRELYLLHHHDGRDLDQHYAEKTLAHVWQIWGRPVHLETVVSEHQTVIMFTGDEILRRPV